MNNAMGKAVGDVDLRVWTPQGARSRSSSRCPPTIERPHRQRGLDVNPLPGDYPLGAWGDESRDYHRRSR